MVLGSEALGHPFQRNTQHPDAGKTIVTKAGVTITSKKDTSRTMKATTWQGKKSIKVQERPVPVVTDPKDVVLRVTTTCICGSDLHLYLGAMVGMQKDDILGHEFMGIVEEVGPEVQNLKVGDRVVACFDIGCDSCFFCKRSLYSGCESTNCSHDEKALYGDTTGGFFGYAHLTGGWEGGQAEYVRVPFADVNCLKVPTEAPDEKYVLLSDILPTAWWATEMGEVAEGDNVAIWGAGPVGILAAHCAQVRGAARVILIDSINNRLDYAKSKLPGLETINFKEKKVYTTLREMLPYGPDVCIEAVGFHYTQSLLHKVEMMAMLETDPSDTLNEMINSCRKQGRISIVGAYAGFTNHFNIGAFMEKGLRMRGGQTPVQRYWKDLLARIESGQLDPTIVITHILPLTDASDAYHVFNDKTDDCIKVLLKPNASEARGKVLSASAASTSPMAAFRPVAPVTNAQATIPGGTSAPPPADLPTSQ